MSHHSLYGGLNTAQLGKAIQMSLALAAAEKDGSSKVGKYLVLKLVGKEEWMILNFTQMFTQELCEAATCYKLKYDTATKGMTADQLASYAESNPGIVVSHNVANAKKVLSRRKDVPKFSKMQGSTMVNGHFTFCPHTCVLEIDRKVFPENTWTYVHTTESKYAHNPQFVPETAWTDDDQKVTIGEYQVVLTEAKVAFKAMSDKGIEVTAVAGPGTDDFQKEVVPVLTSINTKQATVKSTIAVVMKDHIIPLVKQEVMSLQKAEEVKRSDPDLAKIATDTAANAKSAANAAIISVANFAVDQGKNTTNTIVKAAEDNKIVISTSPGTDVDKAIDESSVAISKDTVLVALKDVKEILKTPTAGSEPLTQTQLDNVTKSMAQTLAQTFEDAINAGDSMSGGGNPEILDRLYATYNGLYPVIANIHKYVSVPFPSRASRASRASRGSRGSASRGSASRGSASRASRASRGYRSDIDASV